MVPAAVLIPASAVALADHGGAHDGYGRTMVAFIVLGAVCALIGMAFELAAWAGALRGTRALEETRWFKALLWGGGGALLAMPLFGIGVFLFGSVITAYVVAGPDGATGIDGPIPSKSAVLQWANRGFGAAGGGFVLALAVANLTGPGRLLHGVLWPSLALVSFGIAMIGVGAILIGAAWWGAVFNAHQLPERTWFNWLLWTGIAAALTMPLLGLGVLILAVALTAYRRSAPDDTISRPEIGHMGAA
jgi:hypothetical protein